MYVVFSSIGSSRKDKRRSRADRAEHNDGFSVTIRSSFDGSPSGERRNPSVTSDDCWVPQGETVEIKGLTIHRGFLYVGRGLGGPESYPEITPALINPTLPVDFANPDTAGDTMGYWPSYDTITPQARAAYLHFLAAGGWPAHANPGYVFLYFYGLERRVMVDALGGDERARAEGPAIIEVARQLRDVYGSDSQSIRNYLTQFIDTASILLKLPIDLDQIASDRTSPSLQLKVALGQAVSAGKPIDARLARAMVRSDPLIRSKVAMERCSEEFDALFPLVFKELHGDGIKARVNKSRILIRYQPAARGTPGVNARLDLPDITAVSGPRNKIQKVVDDCCEQLAPLSRHRLNNPDDTDSPKARALLPHALASSAGWSDTGGAIDALRSRVEARLEETTFARLPASELLELFGAEASRTGKVSVETRRLIERLFAGWSLGVAPGLGFTRGTLNRTDKVVIFRQTDPGSDTAGIAFERALIHMRVLGLAYAHTAHAITPAQTALVRRYINGLNGLSSDERLRLEGVLHWLLESRTRHLAGVRKGLAEMTATEISALREFLLRFVSIDGAVSADCVRDLKALMPLLGAEPETLYERLHQLIAEPQEVRPSKSGTPGGRIPPFPSKTDAPENEPTEAPPLTLDQDAIAKREAESAAVSKTLKEIFAEEEEVREAEVEPEQAPSASAGLLPALDSAHREFLTALLAHDGTLSMSEARAHAESHSLLLDGAIDQINEATLDMTGAALLEPDDEELLIDQDILEEVRT
nr:TerB N-terminal domain-containing protein [Methylonatrum kenyense]